MIDVKNHYSLRPMVTAAVEAERDRASRLMQAERRLNDAVQRLEDLLRIRRELNHEPMVASGSGS